MKINDYNRQWICSVHKDQKEDTTSDTLPDILPILRPLKIIKTQHDDIQKTTSTASKTCSKPNEKEKESEKATTARKTLTAKLHSYSVT